MRLNFSAKFYGACFFIFAFFASVVARASSHPSSIKNYRELPLSVRIKWQKLLHLTDDKDDKSVSFRSRVKSPLFLTSLVAPENPEVEWQHLGYAVQNKDLSYVCRFPARWLFYHYYLESTLAEVPCKEFNIWAQGISLESMNFVFAASYLGNPASMMGHNFIRLRRSGMSGETKKYDLLDFGFAFLADSNREMTPEVIYLGLTGGLMGHFILEPYVDLVNRYTFGEQRSLWEIPLPLTEWEKSLAKAHLWELLHVGQSPYYFARTNCSSMMLSYLNAIKPDWPLDSALDAVVLPLESYKLIAKQTKRAELQESSAEFSSQEIHWPSSGEILEELLQKLSQKEEVIFTQLVTGYENALDADNSDLTSIPVSVLDSALAWVSVRKQNMQLEEQTKLREFESKLLVSRLAMKEIPSKRIMHDQAISPSQAHPPAQWGLYTVVKDSETFWKMQMRAGFHDVLDPLAGFDTKTEVTLFGAAMERPINDAESKMSNWQLDLLGLASYSPWQTWDPRFSYRLNVGAKGDDRYEAAVFTGALGMMGEVFGRAHLVGIMPEFAGSYLIGSRGANTHSNWSEARISPTLIALHTLTPLLMMKSTLAYDLTLLQHQNTQSTEKMASLRFLSAFRWSFSKKAYLEGEWNLKGGSLNLSSVGPLKGGGALGLGVRF